MQKNQKTIPLRAVAIMLLQLTVCAVQHTAAQTLSVSDLFAPHMVLQREESVPVWGNAKPESEINLQLVDETDSASPQILATASTLTSSEGNWSAHLPQQSASNANNTLTLIIHSATDEIRISPVYFGDVWICSGQSNMNFIMQPYLPWSEGVLNWEAEVAQAGDPLLNVFTVIPEADWKPASDVHGTWRPDTTTFVPYLSAVPYLFGRELRREKDVPIGIIVAALGATSIKSWMPLETLQDIPAAQSDIQLHATRRQQNAAAIEEYYATTLPAYREQSIQNQLAPTNAAPYSEPYPNWRYQPGGLYHSMLAPLEKLPIKGAAFYQGESDSTQHATYAEYQTAMIQSWRDQWNQPNLPFLIVQIANHDPVETGSDPATYTDVRAALREAQTSTLQLPHTALIITADVGNATNIHPRDKQTVAYRLGLAARHVAYAEENLQHSGPVLKKLNLHQSALQLHFDETGSGLIIDNTRATGDGPDFEIAGADRVFYPASVEIINNYILASSEDVPSPVYLNYAYHNDPKLILYNAEGLPAIPFRAALATEELVAFNFDSSSFDPSSQSPFLAHAEITIGPGITATGYSSARGTPPPSFFIRSNTTPGTLGEAVENDVWLELFIELHPGHELNFNAGGLTFDIARSTTLGTFQFAVRTEYDAFGANWYQKTIETLNESLGNEFISLTPLQNLQSLRVRIYFWDDLNDSSRVFRLDNISLNGVVRHHPQTSIEISDSAGEVVLRWIGVPGRSYEILQSDTPDFSESGATITSEPVPQSGPGQHPIPLTSQSHFFAIGDMIQDKTFNNQK